MNDNLYDNTLYDNTPVTRTQIPIAVRWQIRIIKPKRFVCYADISDVANNEVVNFYSKETVEDQLGRYVDDFVRAKLPPPEVEIVAYDQWGREL